MPKDIEAAESNTVENWPINKFLSKNKKNILKGKSNYNTSVFNKNSMEPAIL